MWWKIAVCTLIVVVLGMWVLLAEASRGAHGILNALSRGAIEASEKAKRMRQCRCGATWDPAVQAHRYCRLTNKRRRWWQWRKREEV